MKNAIGFAFFATVILAGTYGVPFALL